MPEPTKDTFIEIPPISFESMKSEHETMPRHDLLASMRLMAGQLVEEMEEGLDPDEELDTDDILDKVLTEVVQLVPVAAFDPILPSARGVLFFNKEITEQVVNDMQIDLWTCHLNLKEGAPIWIHFSSQGGSIFDGLVLASAIHSLQREGREVNIHIQSTAMSMGSVMAQACDTRTIEETAFFMLHEMQDTLHGRLTDLINDVKFDQAVEDQCLRLFAARTGKPISYYADKHRITNWYLTAQEALAEGLVDEVLPPPRFIYTAPEPAKDRTPRKPRKPKEEKNETPA